MVLIVINFFSQSLNLSIQINLKKRHSCTWSDPSLGDGDSPVILVGIKFQEPGAGGSNSKN